MSRNLSLVLPTFNEASEVASILGRIREALNGLPYHVFVVDDASTDDTAAVARRASEQMPVTLIRNPTTLGYAETLRRGLLAAMGRRGFLITLRADRATDPRIIPDLATAAGYDFDLVIAEHRCAEGAGSLRRTVRSVGRRLSSRVFGTAAAGHPRGSRCHVRLYRQTLLNRLIREHGEDCFVGGSDVQADRQLLQRSRRLRARVLNVAVDTSVEDRSGTRIRVGRKGTWAALARQLAVAFSTRPAAGIQRDIRRKLRPTTRVETAVTVVLDLLAILVAFGSAYLLYSFVADAELLGRSPPTSQTMLWTVALLAFTLLTIFGLQGIYKPTDGILHVSHLKCVVHSYFKSAAAFLTLAFFAAQSKPPRLIILAGLFFTLPLLLLGRRLSAELFMTARRNSSLGRRVLIFGAGETGSLLMKKIMLSPKLGATVVGFLDDLLPVGTLLTCELSRSRKQLFSTRVLGDRRTLEEVVVKHRVDELLIALPQAGNELIEQLLLRARELGIKAGFIPHVAGLRAELLELDEFSASPVVRMTDTGQRQIYEILKRLQDVLVSSTLLGLTLPVWIFAQVRLRRETGGSLLFKQTRVGRYGVPFTILKFRTMKAETDPYASSPASGSDPRVGVVGRIFRATSLDEIPQFLNVLRGDMSLVGPRPEMPFIVANYDRHERRRLQVKPGLTGLWQISPDRSQEIHTNLQYDFSYLVNRGFILDTLILLETVWMVGFQLGQTTLKQLRKLKTHWSDVRYLERTGHPQPVRVRNGSIRGTGREPATVLIALDQRTRSGEPLSWGETAAAVSELVSKVLVRIAVAPRNAERFQQLLAEQLPSMEAGRNSIGQTEFIPYTRPSSVQSAAGHATVVVTDIDLFARLATNGGAHVVQVAPSRGKNDATRSWIVGEIDRILTVAS